MWEQVKTSFEESLRRIAVAAARFLPGLVALVAIVLFSLVVAWIVRIAIGRFLARIGFDQRLHRWGFTSATEWVPSRSPTILAARLGFWVVMLTGFLLGLAAFDTPTTRALALGALAYLPQVVVAGIIFVLGLLAARFIERSVLISAVNMRIHSARLLSLGVKWLIVVLATAMALERLGIGGLLVTISFSILFAGIVLALALAVGLGSREAVSRTLEKQLGKERKRETENDVSHL